MNSLPDILEQIKTHIQKDPKAFEQWCAPIKGSAPQRHRV